MRIVTIFARHGSEKYPDAEQKVNEIFARQLPRIERRAIVIDNSLPSEFVEGSSPSRVLIGGENSSWEFSAWNKGLDFLGDEVWSYDLVHLATSAFYSLYVKYLEHFDQTMLEAINRRPVCLGHIDTYNERVRISSFHSQHWIRTSFLFAPPTELKILRTLASLSNPFHLFGSGPHEPFVPEGFISRNYQSYVLDWLTGTDIGQGSIWHSKIALTDESWPLFKEKATAIFNEHLLSIRLRAQGTRLIDTTWLSSQLKTHSPSRVDWNKPSLDQLAEREFDKVILR
ncbi:MAG: hypothetical protein M3Y72_16485 [Acidobacteriota bacterium]|nr:hypothetical protein [Acidobacteriota bacterium]